MARLHVPVRLRWADLDAYGHVNNVEVLRLLEEVRIQAFWLPDDLGERPSAPPSAVIDASPSSTTLSIIARTEIEYLKTIEYRRSPLDVQVWISRLGGSNVEICYEVRSPAGESPDELFARAATSMVLVEAATMKPRRITAEEREAWKPYVEEPLVFTRR